MRGQMGSRAANRVSGGFHRERRGSHQAPGADVLALRGLGDGGADAGGDGGGDGGKDEDGGAVAELELADGLGDVDERHGSASEQQGVADEPLGAEVLDVGLQVGQLPHGLGHGKAESHCRG